MYSPRWLFFYPGIFLAVIGAVAMIWLMTGPIKIDGISFDVNAMLYAALLVIVGVQTIYFAIFSKVFGVTNKLIPSNKLIDRFLGVFSLERGLAIGGIVVLLGIAGLIYAIMFWGERTFGPLVPGNIMRITIPSITLTLVGVQTIFSSFFLAVLSLKTKN